MHIFVLSWVLLEAFS